MHLCYIDDSGDSRNGVILTALIIDEADWSHNLQVWLDGRREIHRLFGVPKKSELHAVKLYKGRGEFCETPTQNAQFGDPQRAAVGRIMLSHLSRANSRVLSIGAAGRSSSALYAKFVARLEDWAATNDTRLLLFYDGQQGLIDDSSSPRQQREAWEQALRAASPYRDVHRGLELSTRRIVEDVIMQDSRYSQFIQAADLLAYGAFQMHRQSHAEIWGAPSSDASKAATRAYLQMRNHWPAESDNGVTWLS